jgi:hypothetical protein
MARPVDLGGIEWDVVVRDIVTRGWARVARAVARGDCAALEHAARGPWISLPETEGGAGVRQAGLACHSGVDRADEAVWSFAAAILAGIDGAGVPGVPSLPAFNHAQWCRAERGQNSISPHRDPDTAGGVIAILTIRGCAPFQVWDIEGNLAEAQRHPELATGWDTSDGDLVLLRGGGWPTSSAKCPIHEARSPRDGDRVTLTLRSNKNGYGSDYFG